MIKIVRTNSEDPHFIVLVKKLDIYLAEKDGEEHGFYSQYNKLDSIKYVLVAYNNNKAIGCGAIKEYDPNTMEIKRMYTSEENREKGIGSKILQELEKWAYELSFKKCILETGKRQIEAIEFYKKNGYRIIPNYGQYYKMENSMCFCKEFAESTN